MEDKILKLLYDIKTSIETIEMYLKENQTFEYFSTNKMLRQAIERNLEIIGEATNKVLQLDSSIPISNARRIVDTRNKIIHGYDDIEDVNIWVIVINHLPILKTEIDKLLE